MTVAGAPGADVAQDYEQERPARRLAGIPKGLVWTAAGLLSCYALVTVLRPVAVMQYRMTFLAVALPLTFLVYRSGLDLARLRRSRGRSEPGESSEPDRPGEPGRAGEPDEAAEPDRAAAAQRPALLDWLLAAASVAGLVYPLLDFGAFVTRGTDPTGADMMLGGCLTLLILEATRRTVGWVLPAICVA